MTRKEHERAQKLLDDLMAGLSGIQLGKLPADNAGALLNTASRLKKLIQPLPTMQEILMQVPGENHTEKAREIGISRQGYYNLLGGTARPNAMTAKRLAELTGIRLETIKEAWLS